MPGYRRGLRLPGSVVAVVGGGATLDGAVAAALADRGARPVLLGGIDPADADDVREAARHTVERYGRLDGWVQCAAVSPPDAVSGPLADLPDDAVRRVLDVAVLGTLHGARASLPHLAADGGGVLVIVVSVHGQVARPFAAPQGMAHAAVRVLAAALRQELRLSGVRGVAVTTVLVPAFDGPFPARRPARVAATVVGRLHRPGLEKVAGGPLTTAVVHGHALVPAATEWLVAQRLSRSWTQRLSRSWTQRLSRLRRVDPTGGPGG